jgi:hypothetical protein
MGETLAVGRLVHVATTLGKPCDMEGGSGAREAILVEDGGVRFTDGTMLGEAWLRGPGFSG